MKKHIQFKKAFTLIEVLIVLGIAAIVAAAAYFTYNAVRTTNQANEEIRRLAILRDGIRNTYASQRDYQGLTTTTVANSGLVPDGLRVVGGQIYSDLNTSGYNISSNHGIGGSFPQKSFMIIIGVNKKTCEKVAQGLVASWDYVKIMGSTARFWTANTPVDATAILTGCTQSDTDNIIINIGSR